MGEAHPHYGAFLVAQTVNNLPTMRETQVQSLGQEDPLEKGLATHSSILAWRIPWTAEPGGLQYKELDMTEQLTLSLSRCWAGISVPYVLVVLSGQICGVGEDS